MAAAVPAELLNDGDLILLIDKMLGLSGSLLLELGFLLISLFPVGIIGVGAMLIMFALR